MENLGALLPLVLLALVFYWLILRPARKRQQDQRATVAALEPGRDVMTASGLFGTVTAVTPERIEVEIAPGVRVEFLPAAISQVIPTTSPADADLDLSDLDQGELEPTKPLEASYRPEDDTPPR